MTIPIGDGYGSIGSCGQLQVIATQTITADVTPATPTRGIIVGTAGNLAVTLLWETASAVIPAVPAGWHPLRVKTFHSTGSTAQAVTGFW